MKKMKKLRHIALITMLCISIPAINFGQIAPDLNSAGDFAILAATEISFAPPMSTINDLDVGLYPGVLSSISGLENLTLNNGSILASDQDPGNVLPQAKIDLRNAYFYAAAANVPAPATISGNQGGLTLAPGIYKSTSTLSIDGSDLTLDAGGDQNAVWIFQIASSLTTTVGGNIVLINDAKANNVYWQVGSSATIGNDTDFKGNILALVSITMNTGSTLDGRALARNGAVTFAGGGTMNKPEESPVVTGGLSITKTADPQNFSALNEQIDYDIVVTNTGTEVVNNITVEDDLTEFIPGLSQSLNAGSSETFTTSYNITAADLQNGFVSNIASAETVDATVLAYEVVTKEGLLITKVATPQTYSELGAAYLL
ncbi:MAG: ice-binding family protein [Bacteroidota bacterium]|nr:ice-binding family protein [Bacteroidota bacterium]